MEEVEKNEELEKREKFWKLVSRGSIIGMIIVGVMVFLCAVMIGLPKYEEYSKNKDYYEKNVKAFSAIGDHFYDGSEISSIYYPYLRGVNEDPSISEMRERLDMCVSKYGSTKDVELRQLVLNFARACESYANVRVSLEETKFMQNLITALLWAVIAAVVIGMLKYIDLCARDIVDRLEYEIYGDCDDDDVYSDEFDDVV